MKKGKLKKVQDQWVIEHYVQEDDFGMRVLRIETPLFPGPFPLEEGVYIDEILVEGKEYVFEFDGKFAKIHIPRKTENKKYHSDIIEKVLRETPLETLLGVSFTMSDVENWRGGEYLGDMELVIRHVEQALHIIEKWVEGGQKNPIR
jgi:hypothetical protein